jgi:hypothetical protein
MLRIRAAPVLALALLAGCATPSMRSVAPSDHFDGDRFFNSDGAVACRCASAST